MKKATKREHPFEPSCHDFTREERGSFRAESLHTGSPNQRLGGKSAGRGGLSKGPCCISEATSPSGKDLGRGRERRGGQAGTRTPGGERGDRLISVSRWALASVFLICPPAANTQVSKTKYNLSKLRERLWRTQLL